ncbi:unnamed protein product [Sphenostylis stenocarpa]|uniref:Uncharacterized protein n=1 Tax=Sphenostylis stenocarpa TaxID=92480 RepID=A0AA86S9J4_9FABA|nr:unnamed protein product [Sphenostylis stenocarpa]
MASSSHGGSGGGGAARLKNAASTFCSDSQPLIADIRKTVLMMKDIAVQLEKDKHSDKVKELEDAVIELVGLSELSVQFSSAVQVFANRYQPGEELTNFNKLFEDELSNFKANHSSDLPKNPLIRQFKEAVWVRCFVLACR